MKPRFLVSCSVAKATLICAVVGLAAAINQASAAVLSFSGGSGAPLSLTLSSPVSYTLTGLPFTGFQPFFVFQGVGNIFPNAFAGLTGSITYSVNGGASLLLDIVNSDYSANDTTASDPYIFGPGVPSLALGDVLTLSAGTLTTNGNFVMAAPANGDYNSFVANGIGVNIGNEMRVAGVPETGATVALLGASLVGLLALRRRRT